MSIGQLNLLRQILGAGTGTRELSIEAQRRNFDRLFSRIGGLCDAEVATESVDADGVPALWVDARADRSTDASWALLHLHGGGFVSGSSVSHRNLAAHLSRACDAPVLLADYRLAPEHPFPAPLDDAATAWHWLAAARPDQPLGLSGDSAGGGLAVMVARRLRDADVPPPRAVACLSPWVDYAGTTPSLDLHASLDPMVQRPGLERMAELYLDGRDPWDAEITPLSADLEGLPPVLVHAGGDESLLDDAERLTAHLLSHGVEVEHRVWPHMIHAWHLFAGRLEEAQDAVDHVGTFLRSHCEP